MAKTKVLKTKSNAELLSFIINQDPTLSAEIDLPVQGQDLAPIGKLISKNERYKNAFLNTVNLIGLTVIKKNIWQNPWNFTMRGTLAFGQQVREIINDLCNVYDYNENVEDVTRFLETVVPNVFNYIHEINFQKFYETTTSDDQIAMAFTREGGLVAFIEDIVGMLYESYTYDKYIIDKYMLCRRIIDGTVTPSVIELENVYARQVVSQVKAISNKMTFRSPNYNPAGIRRATSFDDQILIVSSDFEAQFSTEVLATSFFKDEAEMRSHLALCDGFGVHDEARLTELLGDQYTAFTEDEVAILEKIPAVLVSREWFMDYEYELTLDGTARYTEFFNPTTLRSNHYLHTWCVFSTSPFENASVFVDAKGIVTGVSVTPDTATLAVGAKLGLTGVVTGSGVFNKAVTWETSDPEVATVSASGIVTAKSAGEVTITATSVYDGTKSGTATITIS
jgi:hypothetical protein